jgi:hypothetical protein
MRVHFRAQPYTVVVFVPPDENRNVTVPGELRVVTPCNVKLLGFAVSVDHGFTTVVLNVELETLLCRNKFMFWEVVATNVPLVATLFVLVETENATATKIPLAYVTP